MDILMLVDRLEAVINGGWRPPMTDKVMIDEREALDVLDLMRTAIPEEIKQSRRLNQDRERIIAEAQADAGRILAQAEEKLDFLVSNHAVVRAAESRASVIEQDAETRADEIRSGADLYARDVLQDLQSRLDRVVSEVTNGIRALEPKYAPLSVPDGSPEYERAPAEAAAE